ncbi:copper resistance CopC family protein [Glaciihabitans sp. UYNi722]|uniref:copper resistance CopC family protein n=1 Tax=Glaciihabitans sp. UYNi722 TaxID=3156344 RepID=UPI0033992941
MATRTQRFGYAAFAVLVATVSVLGLAAPAQAHNYLVSSTPAAGETLTELPAEFSVTTNDLLLKIGNDGSGFALQVQDAKGLYYGDGCIAVDGPGITTDAALGAPGKYTVTWQVISTDGHTVSNEFNFTWQPSSADAKVSTGSKAAPDCNGTLSPNASPQPDATGQKPAVSDNSLGTALWIGGAVVAVGIAVVVTLLLTSRRKKA